MSRAAEGAAAKSGSAKTGAAKADTDAFAANTGFLLPGLRKKRTALSTNAIARNGYLLKRSTKDRNVWKRRFFALRHGELCWWKAHTRAVGPDGETRRRTVPLVGLEVRALGDVDRDLAAEARQQRKRPQAGGGGGGAAILGSLAAKLVAWRANEAVERAAAEAARAALPAHCFELQGRTRRFVLRARSERDRAAWIAALALRARLAGENEMLAVAECMIADTSAQCSGNALGNAGAGGANATRTDAEDDAALRDAFRELELGDFGGSAAGVEEQDDDDCPPLPPD